MNIKAAMKKAIAAADKQGVEYYYMRAECEEDWTPIYAITEIFLVEGEFRDYDQIWQAAYQHIRDAFPGVPWLRYEDLKKTPPTGIVCVRHLKSCGLHCEVEVYDVEKMRALQEKEDAKEKKRKKA